jgi:hypothetical protein
MLTWSNVLRRRSSQPGWVADEWEIEANGSSLPLLGRQADLVKVVASNDPSLGLYTTDNYLLPWDSLRTYMAKHPDDAILYDHGGKRYLVNPASRYPELVTAPSLLVQKLLALRAVDGSDKARCQDVFLPAL